MFGSGARVVKFACWVAFFVVAVEFPYVALAAQQLPDLEVTDFTATGPGTVDVSGKVNVPARVIVRNRGGKGGTGPAAGPFKVAVESTWTGGGGVVAFTVKGQTNAYYPFSTSPLPAGQSITFLGTLIFNSSVHNVTASLRATADSCSGDEFMPAYCRVQEANETNNVSRAISVNIP